MKIEIQNDILTWCQDVFALQSGHLCLWKTFGYVTSNELPVPFQGMAVWRFRSRHFPDMLRVQLSIRSLDNEILNTLGDMEVRPGDAVGDWQIFSCIVNVKTDLKFKEQILCFSDAENSFLAELPIPVVVVQKTA